MSKAEFMNKCENLFNNLLLEQDEQTPDFRDAVGSAVLSGNSLLGQIALTIYQHNLDDTINNFGKLVCKIAYIYKDRTVFDAECVQVIANSNPDYQDVINDMIRQHITRVYTELNNGYSDLNGVIGEFSHNTDLNYHLLTGLEVFEECKVDFGVRGYLESQVIGGFLGQQNLYFNI